MCMKKKIVLVSKFLILYFLSFTFTPPLGVCNLLHDINGKFFVPKKKKKKKTHTSEKKSLR